MSGKSRKKRTPEMSLTKAVSNALVIFIWAFACEFSPDIELLERFKKQVYSVRDSVMAGALTINDIRKALKDDYDLEVY